MGTIITTEDIEKKGMSGDGDTNAGRESGSREFSPGEPGGFGECGEHGETVLEVCQTLNAVHRAQWWGLM